MMVRVVDLTCNLIEEMSRLQRFVTIVEHGHVEHGEKTGKITPEQGVTPFDNILNGKDNNPIGKEIVMIIINLKVLAGVWK